MNNTTRQMRSSYPFFPKRFYGKSNHLQQLSIFYEDQKVFVIELCYQHSII